MVLGLVLPGKDLGTIVPKVCDKVRDWLKPGMLIVPPLVWSATCIGPSYGGLDRQS